VYLHKVVWYGHKKLLLNISNKIFSPTFKEEHKSKSRDFTRDRKLTFDRLIAFQLQKGLKSLSLRLNELSMKLSGFQTVTKSAYTQARKKLRHTAFLDLDNTVLSHAYADSEQIKWNGHRLLAIDGSTILLPDSPEIISEYGSQKIPANNKCEESYLPCGEFLSCYDVLNNLCLSGILEHSKSYEVESAKKLKAAFQSKDLVLFDRHYASYEFIAWLSQQPCDFVIRCPKSTFAAGNRAFRGGPWSRVVAIDCPAGTKKRMKKLGLPTEMTVRFVRVKLSTGETEVLVTSLKDNNYSRESFKEVYGLRWGIETYFSVLKGRLNLENFSGKSKESVLQDLYATIFISNLESCFSKEANSILKIESQENKYQKKVNKAVSFNVLKNKIFDLIYEEQDSAECIMAQMTELFKMSPCLIREGRQEPRDKSGPYKKLRYHKTRRKIVY